MNLQGAGYQVKPMLDGVKDFLKQVRVGDGEELISMYLEIDMDKYIYMLKPSPRLPLSLTCLPSALLCVCGDSVAGPAVSGSGRHEQRATLRAATTCTVRHTTISVSNMDPRRRD